MDAGMAFLAYGECISPHRDHALHPFGLAFSTVMFKIFQFLDVVHFDVSFSTTQLTCMVSIYGRADFMIQLACHEI
jgi:hypothetical protein